MIGILLGSWQKVHLTGMPSSEPTASEVKVELWVGTMLVGLTREIGLIM